MAMALTRGRLRVLCLVVAAYIFYAASYPPYVLILIAGTLFDYWAGHCIHTAKTNTTRRLWMAATVASNLAVLIGFKYIGFLISNLNQALSLLGLDLILPAPNVGLPLGISFFTFQSLSYTIDIYRRVIPPARSLLEFACFISFFPHLVAGPIIRAKDFLPQLEPQKPLRSHQSWLGLGLILVGFFKKSVVGDNVGAFVDPIFANPEMYGGASHWITAIFFAVQIYADFSGYTDVATGLSLLLGIKLRENFHWPYLSASIREFWRRWHMSLSFFLRDYLYHPLGGDRRGPNRTAFNLFAVWFLGGLWHGAAWHFVAWGLYHGALVTSGRFLYATKVGGIIWRSLTVPGQICVTFGLVTLGWVLFRAETLKHAAFMWKNMLIPGEGWLKGSEAFLGLPTALVLVAAGMYIASYLTFNRRPKRTFLVLLPLWSRPIAVALTALVIVVFAGEARRFIYFDF